ncbi:hypothetical protein HYH03_005518 [Edaphochlamys debaryana]|uniref:Uncharacterized protein n=1 Tax=Edaphochlamys debaryana TaxID=47281 RepID=A0A836C121_9CHLO|nr:hypothetical protein HYH03_005518 [Edaphochlamys debaryana]|eukprot:KAG2496285.1 hypothetical protein HYH03_005518 [Edaphochlamys debaryana]
MAKRREERSPLALIRLLLPLACLVAAPPVASTTPLSVVHTVNDLWHSLAMTAAQQAVAAVRKSASVELDLVNVPMDTFQVMVGRQHQLAVEIEGITYNLLVGNEAEALQEARRRAATSASASSSPASAGASASSAAAAAPALPGSAAQSSALSATVASGSAEVAPLKLFTGTAGSRGPRSLELPAATLAGPLELLLSEPEGVAVYTPLPADVGGPVRRVVVEAGATVTIAGLRRVALRKPLDLPRLPGQYLAEAYAQMQLGTAEEGFENSPGIMYLAAEFRKRALKAANGTLGGEGAGKGKKGSAPKPPELLLSFEVETIAPGALTISSVPELPAGQGAPRAAPRLRVKRQPGGTVELSLRQGEVAPVDAGIDYAALSHVWAWPLPHMPAASWLPYETLLRSVLAAHPFHLDSVINKGIGMRLTQSAIQGVHLLAFDMEVRATAPRPAELDGTPFEWNERPLEIWEAIVQVHPRSADAASGKKADAGGPGYTFVPLTAQKKASFQNTLAVSRSALLLSLTNGDNSTALPDSGYDQHEVGLAAYAP